MTRRLVARIRDRGAWRASPRLVVGLHSDAKVSRQAIASMHYFDHEKLDCYQVAVQALVLVDEIARSLPRGYGNLKDQMQRASQSTVLLIAEASARTGADRACRFRQSRAEAGEVACALEVAGKLRVANASKCSEARELLLRVSAMLWPLTRS